MSDRKTPQQVMHELQGVGVVKQVVIYANPQAAKDVFAQFRMGKAVVVGSSKPFDAGPDGQASSAAALKTTSNTAGTSTGFSDPTSAGVVVIAVATDAEADQLV
jgi:hypothetical protein